MARFTLPSTRTFTATMSSIWYMIPYNRDFPITILCFIPLPSRVMKISDVAKDKQILSFCIHHWGF